MRLNGKMVMELTDVNTSEVETIVEENMVTNVLSVKLDAPVSCRLDTPDLDLTCHASTDCPHQHLQVIRST